MSFLPDELAVEPPRQNLRGANHLSVLPALCAGTWGEIYSENGIRHCRTPVFRGFDKAERLAFTYCWGDSMAVDAIILEIFECHRQATVIVPTVMSQLNFKAREDTVARFA
jgi:hypothetical protein